MISGEDMIRREIPDFNFLKLDEVRWMLLEFCQPSKDQRECNLVMNVSYNNGAGIYYLTIKLCDVRQLKLPEIGPGWYQIGELEITEISNRGMEGINYFVLDHLDAISCYCRGIQFITLSKLLGDETEQNVWTSEEGKRYCYPIG